MQFAHAGEPSRVKKTSPVFVFDGEEFVGSRTMQVNDSTDLCVLMSIKIGK